MNDQFDANDLVKFSATPNLDSDGSEVSRQHDFEPTIRIERRTLLKGVGASLFVYFTPGLSNKPASAAVKTSAGFAVSASNVGPYIRIDSDETINIYIGQTEMGQGIMTGLAQIVADALMVDWGSVRVFHSPVDGSVNDANFTNPAFGGSMQATGGSTSMMGWFNPLSTAAVTARKALYGNALKQAKGTTGSIIQGTPTTPAAMSVGGQTLTYGTIVAGTFDPSLNTTDVPNYVSPGIVGAAKPRTDIPAKVDGSAIFGLDVRMPGMVFAAVQHCPTMGGTFSTLPTKPSNAIALVPLLNDQGSKTAFAAVATDTWTAMNIASSYASKVTWTIPSSSASLDSATILSTAQTLMASGTPAISVINPTPDNTVAVYNNAATKMATATYQLPYLAHACMEVLNCTVLISSPAAGKIQCDVWAPTQAQSSVYKKALSLVTAKYGSTNTVSVFVHTTFLGGGLGRKFETDFISQAVQTAIALGVGKPVQLMWPRTQDFKNDKYRPCALINVQASYDAGTGSISSLIYRNVSPSVTVSKGGVASKDNGALAGATNLPYAVQNSRIEYVANPAAIPLGYWRSVGESYNTFAVESAIDELALAAGTDPIVMRQTLLTGRPGRDVLDAVVALAGTVSPATGSARGCAFMKGFGSYIAVIVEVTVNATTGKLSVGKVFCALDCGKVINPSLVESQMQGGIAHGISSALWGQVTFAKGVPNVSNFNAYPVLKLQNMPTVYFKSVDNGNISNTAVKVGGVGETAVPVMAPAIANAYAKLKGIRQRSLPFYPGSTMGGL